MSTITITSAGARSLPAGQILELRDPRGWELRCRTGSLWITLDGEPDDIVLEPGDSFATALRRRMLVLALGDATLEMLAAPAHARADAVLAAA